MYGRADQPSDAPAGREPTDAHLVRLARDGDPRAYEAIVARYREPLRRSCARITPERAEDAVQQALLSAWLALERGAEVRELRPWLYSIARNAAIDQARGVRTELVELGPEVPGGEDPAQAEARRREVTEVLEAVAALPERQRRALVATAVHGRPTEAVAVDLGLSGGALRQLVHRARTTVRAAVPSVGFPVPAWLAEFLGEEGLRRGAVLLSSGSGAAILAKTTATVATVGAVAMSGAAVDRSDLGRGSSSGSSQSASASTSASTGEPRSGGARSAPAGVALIDGAGLLPSSATRTAPTDAANDRSPQPDRDASPSGARRDEATHPLDELQEPETFRVGERWQGRGEGARGEGARDDTPRRHRSGWNAPTSHEGVAASADGEGERDDHSRRGHGRTPRHEEPSISGAPATAPTPSDAPTTAPTPSDAPTTAPTTSQPATATPTTSDPAPADATAPRDISAGAPSSE